MVDVLLTVISIIVYIVIFALCTYVLILYSHPDDNTDAYFPKVIVVLSLSLAIASILMMPLDSASRNSTFGGLPMDVLIITFYIMIGVLAVILIPFAYFFYSSYDPEKGRGNVKSALIGLFAFVIFFTVAIALLYFLVGVADVPIDIQLSNLVPADTPVFANAGELQTATSFTYYANKTQPFQLSILLFFISILAIVGGFLFVLFGGIGLTYLPIDLIYMYKNRPKPINDQEFKARKILLAERADELLKEGYKYRERRPGRSAMNEWKQDVYLLEEEFDLTMAAHKREFPVFFYWGALLLGIVGILLSLTWALHIFLWKIYRFVPFLNDLFFALDGGLVSFFGVIAYCIWALWMMWAVIKGNFAFGLRVPLLFSVHPMKPEGTLMNGFLFNAGLILLSSVGVVQFCSDSFDLYLRSTAFNMIFGLSITNLRILGYFYKVYSWAIIAFALLAIVVFLWTRKKKRVKRVQLAKINVDRINRKGTGKLAGEKPAKR